MIRFNKKDFPVPALPVKNTLFPDIIVCNTLFCSLVSTTGFNTGFLDKDTWLDNVEWLGLELLFIIWVSYEVMLRLRE